MKYIKDTPYASLPEGMLKGQKERVKNLRGKGKK